MSTPRDDAASQLAAVTALHADAVAREGRAAKSRADAADAASKASQAHAEALAASAAAPEKDNLIDRAARAAIRAQHATTAADAAAKAHEGVTREVADAAARVDRAKAAVRVGELGERRAARLEALHADGVALAQHVLLLETLAGKVRQGLVDDDADARELVSIGVATLPCDALPVAAGAGSTFFAAGVGLGQVEQATSLRHLLTGLLPRYSAANVPGVVSALTGLTRPVSMPWSHRSSVEAEIASWQGHTHYGEVSAEREEVRQRELVARRPHLAGTITPQQGPGVVHLSDGSRSPATGVRRIGST